ncbi:MAG: hypothetical protein JXQ76_05390 [Campylobacterales bacterium]|nr:hypothetical protein [Campylobacterales bacterium]
MKSIYTLSLAALFILGGCSLTEDSSKDVETATAYYYNIEGVEYDCGDAPKGTTGSDGSFTYEVGESCTFSIGGKELREVSYRDLSNGVTIVETNDATMQFLMTLDNDGKSTTGIKVLQSVHDFLKTKNQIDDFLIPSFISDNIEISDSSMATLQVGLLVASGYSGEFATSHEARNYINETLTKLKSDDTAFVELR